MQAFPRILRSAWQETAILGLLCLGIMQVSARPADPVDRLSSARLQSIALYASRRTTVPVPSSTPVPASIPVSIPVTVHGVVTFDRQTVVLDQIGAAEVRALGSPAPALGDAVEVSGRMTLDGGPAIEEGTIRRLGRGSMPLPLAVAPDGAADGETGPSQVQALAGLVDALPAGVTGVRLDLGGVQRSFTAVLPGGPLAAGIVPRSLEPGAILQVTGFPTPRPGRPFDAGNAHSLALQTTEGTGLVEHASWWSTRNRVLAAGAGLLLLLLAVALCARLRQARERAIAEERAGIARDIHDTLAQGFAGITLQLEAAEQVIGRDPGRAAELLREALRLIRHSRDESHLSIDILRSLSRSERLDVLIRHCLLQQEATSGVEIALETEGNPVPLSFPLISNLFRITQEALANAVQHAGAGRIVVRVRYGRREVSLEVEDDGRGFNPDQVEGPEQGHFGLTGIRERSSSIGARFGLHTGAGGTLVGVKVAL